MIKKKIASQGGWNISSSYSHHPSSPIEFICRSVWIILNLIEFVVEYGCNSYRTTFPATLKAFVSFPSRSVLRITFFPHFWSCCAMIPKVRQWTL